MKIEGSTLGDKGFNPRDPWETSLLRAFSGVSGWWQNPQLPLSQDPPPEPRRDIAEISGTSLSGDDQSRRHRKGKPKPQGTYRPKGDGGVSIVQEPTTTLDTLG